MAKAKKAKEPKEDRDDNDPRTPVARDGAYVMMLFITLVAIVAGTVFMYLDVNEYSYKDGQRMPPKEPAPTILKLGDKPAPDPVAPKGADPGPAPGPAPAPMGGMPMGGMPMGGMMP